MLVSLKFVYDLAEFLPYRPNKFCSSLCFIHHRHVLVPFAAAFTPKHCENVAVISSNVIWYQFTFICCPKTVFLVLYSLRGRGTRENRTFMKDITPVNSQLYFSILVIYGLKIVGRPTWIPWCLCDL